MLRGYGATSGGFDPFPLAPHLRRLVAGDFSGFLLPYSVPSSASSSVTYVVSGTAELGYSLSLSGAYRDDFKLYDEILS